MKAALQGSRGVTPRMKSALHTLLSPLVNEEVLNAAQHKQAGVSLQTLLAFGQSCTQPAAPDAVKTLQASSQFLHHELPIRLAHRMVELEHLPGGLSDMPSIKEVCSWYRSSFDEIRGHPLPHDRASEASFTRLLATIYEKHAATVVTMARGLQELRAAQHLPPGQPLPFSLSNPLQQWLDIFFTSRLGIRTLMAQHIAMHDPRPGYVGIISTKCCPAEVIATAAEDAREVCLRNYTDAPEVRITGDIALTFPYVPMNLSHVAFELLKNSMRATVEQHEKNGSNGPIPPIEVVIASSKGAEDVAIKVADRGGGIPRSGMKQLFSYLYTTAKPVKLGEGGADFSTRAPMAGLGFGLPLSRVLCKYFGGDLQVLSMEGHGTDAYLYLRRLGDASEPLSECSPTISGFARALARGGREEETLVSPEDTAAAGAGVEGLGMKPHASFRLSIRNAVPSPATPKHE